jgi:hypothetical protein
MKFTLDAGGAQAAGQGIGNIFKAYALGDQYRQQGEMDAMTTTARLGQAQAAARKYNADAALDEYKLGLQKDPMSGCTPWITTLAAKTARHPPNGKSTRTAPAPLTFKGPRTTWPAVASSA